MISFLKSLQELGGGGVSAVGVFLINFGNKMGYIVSDFFESISFNLKFWRHEITLFILT